LRSDGVCAKAVFGIPAENKTADMKEVWRRAEHIVEVLVTGT
jgi:hypothetical protein